MKTNIAWIRKVIIQICFIVLFILSIEGLARIYLNNPEENAWLNSVPKAFKNDKDFHKVITHLNGECFTPPLIHIESLSRYSRDFKCEGLTYKNNKRLTLPIIDKWFKTIHVFGGSTVYGTGAVNEKTIPSYLQLKFGRNNIRVLNYGFPSYVASQQNKAMYYYINDIKEGDIVIYYDGGNDFWNGVLLSNFDDTIIGYNLEHNYQIYIYNLKNWLSKNSKLYKLMSNLRHNRKNPKKCNIDLNSLNKKNIISAATFYANKILEARNIAEKRNAVFYHFLQPTLFDVNEFSEYEQEIFSHHPCYGVARQNKELYDSEFLKISEKSIDLSEILNNKDLFFDYIHLSSNGNKIVSENIINHLNIQ